MKRLIKRIILVFLLLLLILVSYIAYLVYVGGNISEGEKIASYPETKTALIIVDIQEGTTGENSTYQSFIDQGEDLIQVVNKLIAVSEKLGVSVIYIKQETENFTVNFLTNNALDKGTPAAAIDERVNIVSNHIFTKQVQDAFSNPKLDDFLIRNQINRLIFTGLDANACVGATIEAAYNRDYKIIVVEDGVISQSEETKQEKITEFRSAGMQVISSAAVAKLLVD